MLIELNIKLNCTRRQIIAVLLSAYLFSTTICLIIVVYIQIFWGYFFNNTFFGYYIALFVNAVKIIQSVRIR